MLFEIVYILMDKKTVTAKTLAEYFEVSVRTIYRDLDALTLAGIPVYTNRGKGGGISILPEFVLNKSVLNDNEQNDILNALHSLDALNVPDIGPVLNKLGNLFNKSSSEWIDVSFSSWGSDDKEDKKFNDIKTSILKKHISEFDYYDSEGNKTKRSVEPLKLIFKSRGWYLYSFCLKKNDFRMFKISRIRNLIVLENEFEREIPDKVARENRVINPIRLVLKVDSSLSHRLYDEFKLEDISRSGDYFILDTEIPENEWLYSLIMTYGEYAEVMSPKSIKMKIMKKIENMKKMYSIDY